MIDYPKNLSKQPIWWIIDNSMSTTIKPGKHALWWKWCRRLIEDKTSNCQVPTFLLPHMLFWKISTHTALLHIAILICTVSGTPNSEHNLYLPLKLLPRLLSLQMVIIIYPIMNSIYVAITITSMIHNMYIMSITQNCWAHNKFIYFRKFISQKLFADMCIPMQDNILINIT